MQNQQEENPAQVALNYIKSFRRGVDFKSPASGIIINGRPDAAAIEILRDHLAKENANVRENIVNLVADIGLHIGTMAGTGAEVILNDRILKILAVEGLIKPDLGRERALDILRKMGLESDLAHYGDSYVQALKAKPSEELFLLIAKAKTGSAKELVYQLSRSDIWKNVEAVRIARAALGDNDMAVFFIDKLNKAGRAEDFSEALRPLSLIGTTETLKLIARCLRTPLIIDRTGIYKKSVRLDVLEALRYNFPDRLILYPNNINTEADYTAAENFCIRKFGIVYNSTPPPFMTYEGYPVEH